MSNKNILITNKKIFRSSVGTYIVLLIIHLFLLMINFYVGVSLGFEVVLTPIIILIGVFLFVVLWIAAFRIELTDDMVRYRTLFGGWRSLLRHEIERATFETRFRADSKPTFGLTLTPKKETGKVQFAINLKVFRLVDVRSLDDWLQCVSDGEFRESLFAGRERKRRTDNKKAM